MKLKNMLATVEVFGLVFAWACMVAGDAAGGCFGMLLAIYAALHWRWAK